LKDKFQLGCAPCGVSKLALKAEGTIGMERWHLKPKRFAGKLELNGINVAVRFSAAVSKRGEAKVKLDTLPYDMSTKFIADAHYEQRELLRFHEFTLVGAARDGSTFRSEAVIFPSLGSYFSDSEQATLTPVPFCQQCEIVVPAPADAPAGMRVLLRGFECFRPMTSQCPLGTIELRGAWTLKPSEKGLLTGQLAIEEPGDGMDPLTWRAEVDELFKRVRSVMSFARGARLAAPVVESVRNGRVVLEVGARVDEEGHGMGPFSKFDYESVFRLAVASNFHEPAQRKDIDVAVEWFTMRSGYREAQLTGAMTVLEHLLTSNLSDSDREFRPHDDFRKIRNRMLDEAAKALAELGAAPAEIASEISTMRDKMLDLNRRPLTQKIHFLAKRWGIPMDGLSNKALGMAKNARDQIVHQGSYAPPTNANVSLETHIRLVRELVIRFILAALNYEGVYTSPMTGERDREFKALTAQLD
jgi:hypothetical protein